MKAADLLALGLTLQPKQGANDPPGHLIVPEINLTTYHDPITRPHVKEICKSLTDLANRPEGTFFPN